MPSPAKTDLPYRMRDLVRLTEVSAPTIHFYAQQGPIEDDHVPFFDRGIPCADVIDLDYGYNNVFWHSPQDTMDKLSPKSLEIAGDTILETIHMLDQR